MHQTTQLQLSPGGQNSYQPQPVPNLQDKAGTLSPHPQHKPPASRETLLQQPDKDKVMPYHIPHLRAVVESQAFKDILVDEMDMMQSHAATLIQASWRGYLLRQKLSSQILAAKAIQEAWRRFNTKRLFRSGKAVEKKVNVDEGDIPYRPPQQVRFQHLEEGRSLSAPPIMVNKETQFPSADSLAAYTNQLAPPQPQGTPQAPCAPGGPSITFLPDQTISIRLPCPVSLDAMCHPCLLTRTVRSANLVHIEGDTMKTKQVTARANKAGAPGTPQSERYAPVLHGPLKTQTQAFVEAEVLKAPAPTGPVPVMTTTPLQPCLVPTVTMSKTPPQTYPAAALTKTPLQSCLASMMSKASPQPCPAPTAATAKTPPQVYPAAPVAKTPLQSCLTAILNKIPTQPCPVPAIMITKTPPQPCPEAPVTKTPAQMRPMVSMTNTAPQARLAAMMAKITPQICLLTSIIKPPTQTCAVSMMAKTPPQMCPEPVMAKTPMQTCPMPVMAKTPPQMSPVPVMAKTSMQTCPMPTMAEIPPQTCPVTVMAKTLPQTCPVPVVFKTPPQTCPVPVMAKTPLQTCPVPVMAKIPPQMCPVPVIAKTPPQMRLAATMAKTPLQTCPAATITKTPPQTPPGASMTKTPPQARLTAMITKTPAQLRSVATIFRTLCLLPPAAGNLKASPPEAMAAGIPNTLSHIRLNKPKTKAVVTAQQTAGMVKVSSRSHLTERKVKYCPPPHLGAGAPKSPARPLLEAEKIKAFSQKQVKTATKSNTSVAMEVVAEDRNKVSPQARLRTDVVNVQTQVYVPIETAVVLPQAQLGTCPTKALPQAQLATCSTTTSPQGHLLAELTATLPQAHLGTCLSKAPPQAHPPAKPTTAPSVAYPGTCLTKTQSQAHLATGVIKVQSQAYLPTGLTKAQSQDQLVTETAKCLYPAHQAAELSSKIKSQPILTGFKASTQPYQHVGSLGTLSQAKTEDRLTQPPAHSYIQGKATQGPCQGPSKTQSMLVPLLASSGHPTCNVESWGDSGAARAQPSTPSSAAPSQEELATSQLASLCAELATVLGSQEDLRTLLVKALSQGEVRAALNQALSKEILGATIAKALPQGMLGTALMKALSWGELGAALSRVLSQGELRAQLTEAMQGKLVDVLSKALTEEERAALNQALCQGELGAVLSQSLSQAALKTGLVLPKAAASKTAGRGMMVTPAPVEVDYRGRHSTAWGPTPGPVRPQLSKVSVPQDRTWEGFITDRPSGLLEEMGDGAMVRGSPCLSTISVGASLTSRVITTILQYPLMASLDPTLSWEMGPLRDSSLNPFLTPKVSEENMCLHPGASELASNLNPMASDAGPDLPKPPPFQLPPHLWQPLVANGVAPSTSRPSVASGTAPSSHKPHVASRVAPRLSASSGEGRVAPAKAANTVGGGSAAHSHQCPITFGESTCWCQPSRVSRRPPGVYRPSAAKGLQQPSVVSEETMQRTQSPNHKEASVGTSRMINKVTPGLLWATTVSKLPLTRPQTPKACDGTPGHLPGSMAPGHHWALKSQGDPSLLDSTGSLTPTLPHIAVPGQEKNQTWGTISGVCCPQELVTGHILSELGARLPQGSDNDLARKFFQSSTDCSLNVSNSKSSLCSRSSLSLSTMSVDSLTAVDLVGEQSWKASLDEDFLSGEAMGRSQRSEDLEEMERVSHGRMTPNLRHLPPPASKLIPILHLSSVPSHMTLSVHWSSGGQDEKDMSSNQRSMGLKESRFQKPDRTKLKRSLSLDNVVIPLYQQPSVTSRRTPSPSQSSVASKVVPNPSQLSIASLSEPSMVCKVTLSLGRPSKACGVSPSLAQPSMTIGVAPGLAQLSMTSAVAPRLAQPSITSGVTPRTAHATMGNSVGPSPGHPPVMSGVGHVLSQPIWAPGVSSDLLSSKVSAVAPCPCHASFLTEVTSNTPHSFGASGIGLGLSQPSVATGVDRHQDPMIGCGVASNLQAPEFKEVSPGFHPPLSVGGRCPSTTEHSEHSAVTVSTSNLYQSSVTIGKDSCLGQGTRLSQGILFGSMATRTSQGTMAASMLPNVSWGTLAANKFLSMSRGPMCPGVTRSMCRRSVATATGPRQSQVGSSTAPTSSWASVTGSPFHGQATGVGPGFSPALVPIGLGLSSSKFSQTNVGPSISQVNVDLPIAMDHQCPPVSIVTTPSDQQSNAFSQEPVMGMASLLVPGSVANRMTTAVAPVTVASGMAPSPPPGSMTRDVVPRLPLGYMVSCVAQTLPPGSVINGMGQALPPYPMASAEAHSLPSGSVVSGVAQSFPPGFVTSGMAKTLSPGSVVSGVPPRLIVAHGAVGNRRSPSVRPPTNRTSPSLLLGSVASGVGPSVSSGSVASSVVPAFMAKGPNQSLFLGSTATAAGRPSTVGSVAHSPPQGSMLVGLTPRPYHRVMTREESIAPLQASHATGLAEVHPQALEASGRARGVYQVPMILQRASQLSCTLGAMAFETGDGQAIMKPEDLNEILSQASRSTRESIVLEATPLMSESPLVPDVDYGCKFLAEDRSVPKGQRLPLEKVAPSQAKCLTSGMAPVLPPSPTFAKHAKASSVTPILQQRSATNWRDPSSHSMAAREVPSVQTESVKNTGAPLAHQASVAHIMPWSPSAACVPQGPSASHVPRSHSHEMVACTVISGSHKLAPGSSVSPSLHLGSVSGMGTPSTSQRSGVTSVASHVLPYPSKASRAALGGFQVEAVPSVVWKPVSGNLSQSSHHQSLGPRKSYRSKHSSFVSRILDGSVAKIKPSQQVGEHASRSTQGGPKGAVGVPPAIKPITRTGNLAHDMTIPRLHHGVQRVCLGYESSPSGSQKPLFNWESLQGPQDFHSAVTPVDSHRAPLTPTVLQGPGNTGVAGGQTRNAAVPSVVISSTNRAVAPGGVWEPARCAVPWDAVGSEAAVDPRRSGKLVASVQTVEKIIVQAVVTIQACARSYLVRRTIKLWHRWAIIIQAAWRGYRVRRNLTQLCRAATIIQAMWRGYYIRRSCAQQTLLWGTWAEVGSRAKSTSKHRCFQSCQPHVCAFCQSLSTGLGNFPTVVMLVASSPRTCHICGHTLPTQVVQGMGQGTTGQAGKPRGYDTQLTHRSTQKLHCQDKAAAVIQSAWRGFVVRRQLRQQQAAAKKLQATWRGHYTRASLTTDALLGPAVWENPQNMQWSGV